MSNTHEMFYRPLILRKLKDMADELGMDMHELLYSVLIHTKAYEGRKKSKNNLSWLLTADDQDIDESIEKAIIYERGE